MSHLLPERYMVSLFEETKKSVPEKYTAWERNVIDEYKPLSNEEICIKVAEKRLPFAVLMTHINIDYNLGAVLRIGNCLGAKVFYYGQKKWDKRSATGVWNYTPINYLSSLAEVKALKAQYDFVALEQTKESVFLPRFKWPKQSLILLGEESCGLQGAPEILELANHFVEIPQRGSVRSMNAATAFAIAAYDYTTKLLW
jgi:tRNA G18 (ribose-2'-O)-methylase SpoU